MMIGKIDGQNLRLYSPAMNQNNSNKNETKAEKKQEENKSIAIISPASKKQSMIQQLIKQKQNITDRINSLSKSPDFGSESIQDQMEELQKQMDAIDTQIVELQMQVEDTKKQDSKLATYEKPKTKEEAQQKKLNNIMNLAASSDQADVTISVKGQVDRKINVLNSEIKTGYGDIKSKMEEVAKLENKSANLASQLSEDMDDIIDDINLARDESISYVKNPKKIKEDDSEKEVGFTGTNIFEENIKNKI